MYYNIQKKIYEMLTIHVLTNMEKEEKVIIYKEKT